MTETLIISISQWGTTNQYKPKIEKKIKRVVLILSKAQKLQMTQ